MSHGFVNWAPSVTGMITLVVGLPAAAFALYNVYTSSRWKRAELASGFFKELNTSEELQFVCRALEWDSCRLVVPQNLRPLVGDRKIITHELSVYIKAMPAVISTESLELDLRIQLYRSATDSFLVWLETVRSAIERKLFKPADLEVVAYWLLIIIDCVWLDEYIRGYGFRHSIDRLLVKYDIQIKAIASRVKINATTGKGNPIVLERNVSRHP